MPGIAIKPTVLNELQRQMNHEMAAAHAYEAVALWCEEQNFKGFGRFFAKQAAEEREHARKFMDHLLDRGVRPALGAIGRRAEGPSARWRRWRRTRARWSRRTPRA